MSSEDISQTLAARQATDSKWDVVLKKSCIGASHWNGNLEIYGSFTYRQKNCATKEDCDAIIETFTRMIKDTITEETTEKQP